MNTISTILSKTPELSPDQSGMAGTQMAGAFAIFEAVLATISAQQIDGEAQTADSPELSAETLLDQIMSDESVSPYINAEDSQDLLPILDRILENPDQIRAIIDLDDAQAKWAGHAIKTAGADMSAGGNAADAPIPPAAPAAALAEELTPAPVKENLTATTAIFTTAPAARGRYNQPKNPVQVMASILRKITPAKPVSQATIAAGSLPAAITPNNSGQPIPPVAETAYGPFPGNSAEAEAVTSHLRGLMPTTANTGNKGRPIIASAQPASPQAASSADVDGTRLTMDPATIARTDTRPAGSHDPISLQHTGFLPGKGSLPTEEQMPQPASHPGKLEDSGRSALPATPDIPFLKPALFKPAASQMMEPAAEPGLDAMAAESLHASRQVTSARHATHLAVNHVSGPALSMGSGEQGGQFNQQQSPQSGMDTSMGLDQGRDARLLRLSVNDNGWQDRLIRHIQSSRNGSSDQRITVQLQPRNLGRLTLNISVSNTTTSVHIVASSAEAAALLHESEARLQQAFDQQGMKLGSMQTSTQHGGQQNTQQGSHRNTGAGHAETTRDEPPADENSSTKIVENANNSQINILA